MKILSEISHVAPAETQPSSGTSTPRITLHHEADTRHLSARGSRPAPNPSSESKDISDGGGSSDEDEDRGTEGEEEEEEEMTPEQLIPQYINIQTLIYHLHPASTTPTTGNKAGKGRKQAKSPVGLSAQKMKELKKLQDRLGILSRDPLFDLREAEYFWAEERLRLEKEEWSKKQPEGKWAKNPKKSRTPKAPSPPVPESDDEESSDGGIPLFSSSKSAPAFATEEYDSDQGLMGGLFEPPPTEETTVGQPEQEKVSIRDFEEIVSAGSNFGKNKPKGKAGVGSAAVKRVLEEVCKSRYVILILSASLAEIWLNGSQGRKFKNPVRIDPRHVDIHSCSFNYQLVFYYCCLINKSYTCLRWAASSRSYHAIPT